MIHYESIPNQQLNILLSSLSSLKYELYPSGSRYYEIHDSESDNDFIMQEPELGVETWGIYFTNLGFWFLPLPSDEFTVKPLYLMRHALGIDIIVVKEAKVCWKIQQLTKKYGIFGRNIDFSTKNNRVYFLKFCLELMKGDDDTSLVRRFRDKAEWDKCYAVCVAEREMSAHTPCACTCHSIEGHAVDHEIGWTMLDLQSNLARVTAERDTLVKKWEYLWRAGCPECGSEPGCNIDCRVCVVYARLEKLETER